MCGIAGYIGKNILEKKRLDKCLDLMKRRGPDSQGTYHNLTPNGGNVYLLHSRLSILDLDERANQPFKDDRYALVFNGEIYNYRQFKNDLSKNGWSPKGTGDTEILFALLKQKKEECLSDLEGMWSFAFYDSETGGLILSRDRFGEKPLYIFEDINGDVYFGSEPKFIFALRGKSLEINFNQINRYLVNGYKSLFKNPETFFKNLEILPPATSICLHYKKRYPKKDYWKPNLFQISFKDISFDEAVMGVKEGLKKSLLLRLNADVPIAFCLSGGVDSNALASIARKELNKEVVGFSIVNSDSRYDEYDFIKTAVNDLHIEHYEIKIKSDNFLRDLKTLIKYHDSPVHTITYFAHWQLMHCISENGFKVSISGTGADEIFSGYYDHHNFFLAEMAMTNNTNFQEYLNNWKINVGPIVRNPFLKDPECFINSPELRDHIYLNAKEFASYLQSEFKEPFDEHFFSGSTLRNRMANELFYEIVPPILSQDDLNSMYYSVENRSPFLDTNLFEFTKSLPTEYLIQNGRAKALLRESVRGICSDSIIDNPRKVGFNAPIEDYFDLDDNNNMCFMLDKKSLIYEHLSFSGIESFLKKRKYSNSESKFLFNLLCTKLFLEEYS